MATIELGPNQPAPRISKSGKTAAMCTISFFLLVAFTVLDGTTGQKIDGNESLYAVFAVNLRMNRYTVQDGTLSLGSTHDRRVLDTPRLLRSLGMTRDEYVSTMPGDMLRCKNRVHRGFFTNLRFETQFMCRRKAREGPDAASGPFDFIKMP